MKSIKCFILLCMLPCIVINCLSCQDNSLKLETTNADRYQYVWNYPVGNDPWNYTAQSGGGHTDNFPPDGDWKYSIALAQSQYVTAPSSITCIITNNGIDGVFLNKIYIEKWDHDLESLGYDAWIEEQSIPGWIRIPFIMDYYWLEYSADGRIAKGEIDLYKHLKADYQYTKGHYRIVFPLPDATHYAYFNISE